MEVKMDLMKMNYVEEIVKLIQQTEATKLRKLLENYHENDLADSLEYLSYEDRLKLYEALDNEQIAEIFAYLEDASFYFKEMELEKAAHII